MATNFLRSATTSEEFKVTHSSAKGKAIAIERSDPIFPSLVKEGLSYPVFHEWEVIPSTAPSVLNQTTTFGIRKYKVVRTVLTREFKEVDSQFGKIKVKIGKYNNDIKSFSPEYEDCKRIAEERGIPLKQVYSIISKEFWH